MTADSIQQRLKKLESRCSDWALEFLRQLEGHLKLPLLLTELEQIHGKIYRVDIEGIFLKLTDGEHKPDLASDSSRPSHP